MGHCHIDSLNWPIPELWKCAKPSVVAWQCVNKEGKAKWPGIQRMAKDSDFSFMEGVYMPTYQRSLQWGLSTVELPSENKDLW